MQRPVGMAQRAFASYVLACFQAGVDPEKTASGGKRVVQTIGSAAASAGTHARDGADEHGFDYSAAVDISVRHDLTQAATEQLLKCLWANGFAAWWRHIGSFADNQHIHAVFCGVKMKHILRNQVHSFLKHRSGLVGDAADEFVRNNLTETAEQHCRTLFLQHNQTVG